jgi:hypothetical protein
VALHRQRFVRLLKVLHVDSREGYLDGFRGLLDVFDARDLIRSEAGNKYDSGKTMFS